MKLGTWTTAAALLVLGATLAACGGGGDDEAGSLTSFGVQPSTMTLTAAPATAGGPATGSCSGGYAGDVFIYGGAAPYRLDNTTPDAVLLHKSSTDLSPVSSVSDRGGSFSVSYAGGGCFSPILVIVVDKLDRQVVLTLNNKPAS